MTICFVFVSRNNRYEDGYQCTTVEACVLFRSQTALHKAAWNRRQEVCLMLVAAGASLTTTDHQVVYNSQHILIFSHYCRNKWNNQLFL